MVGDLQEYHITLYYHDQANNLVKTISPNGVQPLTVAEINQSVEFRKSGMGSPVYPPHTFETRYLYNSLDEVIVQKSPDVAAKRLWYDEVGRLVISESFADNTFYAYTRYDELGRVFEMGNVSPGNGQPLMSDELARGQGSISLDDWILAGSRSDVTRTFYDDVARDENGDILSDLSSILPEGQENLRPRVSSTFTYRDALFGLDSYDYATHYSYDVTGNVKTVIQENKYVSANSELRYKRIDYEYDYISGNVHKVYYQRGQQDQFTYHYEYDDNNRLLACYTSAIETSNNDSPFWTTDGTNEYYLHGALSRMEVGEQRVQGLDYAYTLQGWIKGVNSSVLDPERDMGRDGTSATSVTKDAFSYVLGYYEGDYEQVAGVPFELDYITNTDFNNASPSLYNGNIRNMTVSIEGVISDANVGLATQGYTYEYDQLHRIKSMTPWTKINPNLYQWNNQGGTPSDRDYAVGGISYDGNGNILTLQRRGTNFR